MWISPLALSEQLQKWKVFENRQMGLKRTNGFRSLQNRNTDASEANTNLSALGMEQSASFFFNSKTWLCSCSHWLAFTGTCLAF